jgi:tripartite-type tricarboxylate transporter receptor subunit TctC
MAILRLSRSISVLMLYVTLTFAGITIATAQQFPTRPLRFITAEAGGGADFVARIVGQYLGQSIGQQVIVENQGGANGIIAAQSVMRAPADGYVLLFYASNIWLLPTLQSNVPYDPIRDFAPVTLADRSPSILVVHPTMPVRTPQELIALARSRPGDINFGTGSTGAAPHLATELFKLMTGVNIVRINFKGTGPAVTAVVGGQIHMMFATSGSVAGHVKSGRLRGLAVTSAQPSRLAPELPTLSSAGVPGYEADASHGFLVKAGTPEAIVSRLHQEIVKVLANPELQSRFLVGGVESVGTTPAQFGASIRDDIVKWGKVAAAAGLKPE